MANDSNPNIKNRLISRKEIVKITGMSEWTLNELERNGKFPSRRKIGARKVAWLSSDIEDWMENLEKRSV